jgi:hypothetical protein
MPLEEAWPFSFALPKEVAKILSPGETGMVMEGTFLEEC